MGTKNTIVFLTGLPGAGKTYNAFTKRFSGYVYFPLGVFREVLRSKNMYGNCDELFEFLKNWKEQFKCGVAKSGVWEHIRAFRVRLALPVGGENGDGVTAKQRKKCILKSLSAWQDCDKIVVEGEYVNKGDVLSEFIDCSKQLGFGVKVWYLLRPFSDMLESRKQKFIERRTYDRSNLDWYLAAHVKTVCVVSDTAAKYGVEFRVINSDKLRD